MASCGEESQRAWVASELSVRCEGGGGGWGGGVGGGGEGGGGVGGRGGGGGGLAAQEVLGREAQVRGLLSGASDLCSPA